MSRALSRLREFLQLESAAGIVLIIAACLALIASNSPVSGGYFAAFSYPLMIGWAEWSLTKPVGVWINDALMAVFFLLVGLEIKREMTEGALASRAKASLPAIAAIGGMVGPVLVFFLINQNSPATIDGWAIPAATDIAFALGILILIGARAPTELKILLLAIAIIDDLGAISIIALFYTENLALEPLFYAAAATAVLWGLNRSKIAPLWIYLLVGALLWYFVLKSGVHATLAGVVTAAFIPVRAGGGSPLIKLEHALHPYVAFAILPIFAFANAGVVLSGLSFADLQAPLTLGIVLGLVIGKQIGVFGAIWLAVKAGWAQRPEGVSWLQLYGLACLTGVGFTMSLFIGGLAFDEATRLAEIRIGVLAGSVISAAMGVGVLLAASRSPAQAGPKSGSSSSQPLAIGDSQ